MSKFSYKTLFIIFFFLLIGIVVLLRFVFPNQKASAAWWNETWMYRKSVSIGNTGSTTTNQYIKITLDTSTLITANKMQSTCNDIRVTNINGKLLTHFIDGNATYTCNTSTTSIYVLVDSIPSSGSTVYIYYGNPSTPNAEPVLGTNDNPGLSCRTIKEHQNNGNTDGLYYIAPTGNIANKIQAYCNMTSNNGGWTLIFQRRGGYNNVESCQSNLNSFLRNSCGSVSSLNYGDSYSMDLDNISNYGEFFITDYDSNLTNDTGDAFIVHSTNNIFPDSINSLQNIAVTSICDINNSNCDTTDTYFLYTGNSWFSNSVCNEGYAGDTTTYPGNYGYCQNGISTGYSSNGLFGDRDNYNETKLWAHPNTASTYMEKVFIRESTYSFTTFTSGTPATEELSPGPIAYWKFDEGVGTTIRDSSGNLNTGTINGAATWTSEDQCINGKCLSFDSNSNDYITSNNNLSLTGSQTYSVWVYPKSADWLMGVLTTHDYTNTSNIGINISTNKFSMSIGYTDGSREFETRQSNYTIPLNTWSHVELVYDASDNSVTFYVNGKFDSRWTLATAVKFVPNKILVGQWSNNYYGAYKFNGYIDEAKIYPYARTAAQIKLDYNSRGSKKGSSVNLGIKSNTAPDLNSKLVGYWKFDEGVSTTVYDSSPNKYTASVGTGISFDNNGKYGKAVRFNNINVALNTNNASILNMTTNNFTLSAYYYSLDTGSNVIMEKRGTGLNGFLYLVNNTPGSGDVTVYLNDGGSQKVYVFNSANIEANKWYHLVTTINRQTNEAKLYVDGKYVQTIDISATSGSLTSDGTFRMGYDLGGATFNGLLDEVKVYNAALSADEVKQDYNRGSAIQMGATNQTIGGTTTSLDYCIPGDTSTCSPPVAEYKFEENIGTTAYDTSGNNRNLTIYNSPIWTSGNKNGAALDFNGSNQYARRTSDSSFDRTDGQALTVSAWIYPRRLSGQYQDIVVNRSGSGYNWMLYQHTDDGSIQLHGASQYKSSYIPPLNKWTHLEAVVTTSGSYSLYANGLVVQGPMAYQYHADAPGELSIGSFATYEYFSGKIDNVKIYDYARTPAQVAYDYNKGDPIGWWKLDECQGLTAFDSSGLGNTGTISIGQNGTQNSLGTCQIGTSAAWTAGASGKINSSLNFDGTDDYVTVSDNSSLNPTNGITVSAWIKPNVLQTGNFINKGDNSGYRIRINSDGTITFFDRGGNNPITSNKICPSGIWCHVVATGDSSGLKIFINGQLDKQNSTPYGSPITSANLIFGNYGGVEYFSGKLDDVRVYNYALTPDQIKTVYNGGSVNFN